MAEMKFSLTSESFAHGERIPQRHTCEGEDVSPPLVWSHAPDGTRSFVLLVTDPDAPTGAFTHWVLFDLPAQTAELPEDAKGSSGVAGRNDFQKPGWGGPCPPPRHGDHRYFFRLFAVDLETLDLAEGASRSEVERALEGHVIDRAELMGRYQR